MLKLTTFLKQELNLPENIVPNLVDYFIEVKILKGEYLVKKGEFCQQMCWIKQGYLRFFSYSEEKVITHWIFGKDQFVTDIASFYLKQPAKWNIQALTDTTIFKIDDHDYQNLRSQTPNWSQYERLLLVKLMSGLENRVYTLLSMSAEERYQFLLETDRNIFNELPLQYLASMLGMSPETLSRIRSKFNS